MSRPSLDGGARPSSRPPHPPRFSADDLATALGTDLPTEEQRAVVEFDLSPAVVVAGAGSGKTETMASRVIWLIANDYVRPEEVLGLTFTRKAAHELSARLAVKLEQLRRTGLWLPDGQEEAVDGEAFDLPTVSTYHAYAGRLVAEHGLRLGVEPDSQLLSEAACWQLAHDVVSGYDGDMTATEKAESTVVRAVLDLAGELGEHLVEPEDALAWLEQLADRVAQLPGRDGRRPLAAGRDLAAALREQALVYPIVQRYRQAKTARTALDFGDQMALAARLARDVAAVADGERARYRAVLLDEFQDTSEAQMVLMSSLFGGLDLPITAVGDPHQSIYGWRGASASTLSRFPEVFAAAGRSAVVLSLSTSWRNARSVLAAANAVAGDLQAATRIPVRTLSPAPSAGPGLVEVARLVDQIEEADHVAGWVAEHFGPGRTAAVLCRARAQFPAVVDALRRRGLPVEVVGLGGLLDTPEILDLVAVLWATQEPTRGDQVMRLLTGPVCRLGAGDVDALWAWARELSRPGDGAGPHGREHAPVLAEALDHPPPVGWLGPGGRQLSPEGGDRVRRLASVLRRLRSLTGLALPDLVVEAERSLGLDLEVAADPDLHPAWGRAQLDALADVAAGYAASAERPTLGGFLDWLDAARAHERGLEEAEVPELAEVHVDAGAVQVLTVHAAKGLEWDIVAVPGLVEGTFPSGRVQPKAQADGWVLGPRKDRTWLTGIGRLPTPLRGDRQDRPDLGWQAVADTHELRDALEEMALEGGAYAVREERRLAYVAFTRARRRMLLTAPVWSTGKLPRVTSRFLEEVRTSTEVEVSVRGWAELPDPLDPAQHQNPRLAEEETAPWPTSPEARRDAVRDVGHALVTARTAGPAGGPPTPEQVEWERRARLLLADRARAVVADGPAELPDHLSTSAVVELSRDPEAFRAALRRPVPRPPAPRARTGTAFHAWVEQHYAAAALVDLDDLEKDSPDGAPAQELAQLQENFLASEWADRSPVAVEVAVETTVAGRRVRGRLDAVFADDDGGLTLVDWKTGSPGTAEAQRHRALQLAIYRVAYARLTGRPPAQVRAAFFYAATGTTVRPHLPDEVDLERLLDDLVEGRAAGQEGAAPSG
ncbi:ATP-dependent DNA helicase [uncultured Ornithinimicrobium sp.]|uniref:ATP-dependent helicase n=1 Tax=uncultured Ornithinimicrobium sp. TaxID=259307 RepID=UPI002596A996|nr:ATP-dependent DNA helicase [uncultured Ornithinimicrobium sp.]